MVFLCGDDTGGSVGAPFFDAVPSIPAMPVAWDFPGKYNNSKLHESRLAQGSALAAKSMRTCKPGREEVGSLPQRTGTGRFLNREATGLIAMLPGL